MIGNGVALDIPRLFKEIKSITDRNVPMPKILVSNRAQIVMPYHVLFDQYEEEASGRQNLSIEQKSWYCSDFIQINTQRSDFQVSELSTMSC